MPIYLQAYLNLAYDRLEDQKKEAGRITNVDLQKKVRIIQIEQSNLDDNHAMHSDIAGGLNILLFVCGDAAICGSNFDVLVFCFNV